MEKQSLLAIKELTVSLERCQNSSKEQLKELVDQISVNHHQLIKEFPIKDAWKQK